MKAIRIFFVFLLTAIIVSCSNEPQSEGERLLKLKYEEDYTPTYYEVIEMYKLLDEEYSIAELQDVYGLTDSGKPLHLFVIDKDKDFNREQIERPKSEAAGVQTNNKRMAVPGGIPPSTQMPAAMVVAPACPFRKATCPLPLVGHCAFLHGTPAILWAGTSPCVNRTAR